MVARVIAALICLLTCLALPPAHALTAAQAGRIAAGDNDDRVTARNEVVATGDAALEPFVKALLGDAVKTAGGKAYIVTAGKAVDAASGAAATLPADAEDAVNNNAMRSELEAAVAVLKLVSPEPAVRAAAITELKDQVDEGKLGLIDKAIGAETDAELKSRLLLLRAAVLISSTDPAKRAQAARALTGSSSTATRSLLLEKLAAEQDPQARAAMQAAIDSVSGQLVWGERLGLLFTGASLGSILLLVALGLAITYGLMGVINMAHGELMMIGAYASYVVQNLFRSWLPGLFDGYIVLAIPAAFLASAAVGAVLERSVIRWLYGRPLETLLATWGISLVLMQAVRSLFGAQNVGVENPAWMSGGVQVLPNLLLPYNRLAILVFAGLAGCALSPVGNVGPDLGQGYIVDSFMVVVLGGVGQLAGTVYAALGLGLMNKLLEGWAGAVLAKIMVLVFIVVFIQKRPQGLFAVKGRSAEA